jgi:serine phosphatase RsbU (regulator of sigma subunit)
MLELPTRISDWLLRLVTAQRSVAYLLIDARHAVARAGGDLQYHGLTGLTPGRSASEQWSFLEGLLPLPETPFLLQSVGMPSGRVADVHFFTEEDHTCVVLLDVTAEHDEARIVQQRAYDMTLLSQREARLIAKLEAAHADLTVAHRELADSRDALLRSHRRLERELRDAERYVRAILPAPMQAPFDVDWRFVPSTELGGDSFGYHWIDSDHFVLYVLDVSGHGVGAALLSVAVTNALRSGELQTDYRRPEEVLGLLNRAFQMADHDGMYFTIWYGVYHHPTRRLRHASAGHPPAILVRGPRDGRGEAIRLSSPGLLLGVMPHASYESEECTIDSPSRLFLFSDGVYEVHRPDDTMMEFSELEAVLTAPVSGEQSELDEVLRFAQRTRGRTLLEDDFSIIRMTI